MTITVYSTCNTNSSSSSYMCVSGKNIDNAFLIFISTFFYLWQEYTASIYTSIMIHKNVIALKIDVLPESFGSSGRHNGI